MNRVDEALRFFAQHFELIFRDRAFEDEETLLLVSTFVFVGDQGLVLSETHVLAPVLSCVALTTFCGLPDRNAPILAAVMFMMRCRAACVAQAMCGVMTQLRAVSSGWSAAIGSAETTSTAAPAN